MSSLKVRDIAGSLQRKGFKETNGDHKFYVYYDGEHETDIRTKISHSEKEIGEPLIGKMSRQMKLSKDEFKHFVECTFTKEQYAEKLRSLGFI